MPTIYRPKGRAQEYAGLACNIYLKCEFGCLYCYCPKVLHISPEEFHQRPEVRPHFLESLDRDAKRWDGVKESVLLSFIGDCYQPAEADLHLTRSAIEILHSRGFPVTILTKVGPLAQRDFDLLKPKAEVTTFGREAEYLPGDTFATTLTCIRDEDSLKWEPRAASFAQRFANLAAAKARGLETWVSLEPVLDSLWTKAAIMQAVDVVDHFKVGTLNYHPHGRTIDWKRFGFEVVELLEGLRKPYYLKKDLRREMGLA